VEEFLRGAAQDALVDEEGHGAVGGDVDVDVGGSQAGLEAVQTLGGDLDVGDVAAVGDRGDGEAASCLEAGEQGVEVGAGLEKAVGEAGKGVERGDGGLPSLVDHAPVDVAHVAGAGDEVLLAAEHGAVGGSEVFVEGDVDGVEESGCAAQVEVGGAGQEEGASAVPVHADVAFAGKGGDALELGEGDAGAVLAADGAFEGDGADLDGEASLLGGVDGGENLVVGGRCLAGGDGNEVEAAEDLGGVALVEVEVALFLDDDMVVLAREKTDGEIVGERAGGEEGGVLFAERGGDGGLKLVDGAVGEVDVGDVGGLLEELGELLGASEGGDGDSVADESYGAVRDRRDGSSGSMRSLAKQHGRGLQQAEAGGGGRRRGEEVAAIELHATLFRVRVRSTKVSPCFGERLIVGAI
jgi:hypothetical protein